ncbi:MAG TPA: hypothetical protein DD979_05365 [Gammaproteobacteria bacterium]|nr:hypothetical protein [Gammaproteobacteria bacterium]
MQISVPHDRVLAVLSGHIGEKNGISAAELAAECYSAVEEVITSPNPQRVSQRALRQAIMELRLKGSHICGTPETGYYIAEDSGELDRTLQFLLSRAMTSLRQISAMKNVALPDLHGQLNIPYEDCI